MVDYLLQDTRAQVFKAFGAAKNGPVKQSYQTIYSTDKE